MSRLTILCGAAALSLLMAPPPSRAQSASPDELRVIATEAYVYLYPLVTMDISRKQMTNVSKLEALAAPTNQFLNMRAYPTADMRQVVRPNFDTLYSVAWLDVAKEPVVLSIPDTKGRYYLMPMLDMWTDVFASPGWRTTGTGPQTYLIASPSWKPEIRDNLESLGLPAGTQRLDAPTPNVWIIGRTKTDGPSDYPAVHAIQDQLKITPLAQWGKAYTPPPGPVDATTDMKTPPKTQVDTMSGEKFFAYAAEIMKTNPPHLTDQPIVARMKRLGLVAGQSFDPSKADANVRAALNQAPREGLTVMQQQVPTLARVANNWSLNTNTMGVYGNYYVKRAIVANMGLGANLPEDAIYPLNLGDKDGQPLDGKNAYTIHFAKGDLPPANAFWSITLYDSDGFQVANPLNRFAVSSWNDLVYNSDGSLDLFIQNADPGEGRRSNWLPAPKGAFNLTMRLYAPAYSALLGRWVPPAIDKVQTLSPIVAQ
jgi:hypothetical protein